MFGKKREEGGGQMRWILALYIAFASSLALAAEPPTWAFPIAEKVLPPAPPDDGKPKQMPGSSRSYTLKEISDNTNPPDWYPDEHPPMPEVVAHGAKDVRACSTCHLPNGLGHPESANLAGLPAAYFERQMADFKSGKRKGNSDSMTNFAKAISDADLKEASAYFAALKPVRWTRVVETDTVPQTFVGKGNMRFVLPGGAPEPLGQRIIEVPEDAVRADARDGHSGFVAYVPKGSLAKGEALVKQGGGKTIPCASCHGSDLRGQGEAPRIAGRSTIYVVRQLWQIQQGGRDNELSQTMQPAAKNLDVDDMIAIAAYVAAQEP
jgi:cytochrome c553